jgi:hypothetical protein
MTDLGQNASIYSHALAINDRGISVGYADLSDAMRAVFWTSR